MTAEEREARTGGSTGARTNWVRNVLAADGCTLRWRGSDHPTDHPRIVDEEVARPYYGRLTRMIARRLFPADDWLLLHPSRFVSTTSGVG
jgi:hypothetical protein